MLSELNIVQSEADLRFDHENGHLYVFSYSGTGASIDLTKAEAIKLASRLIQWGGEGSALAAHDAEVARKTLEDYAVALEENPSSESWFGAAMFVADIRDWAASISTDKAGAGE